MKIFSLIGFLLCSIPALALADNWDADAYTIKNVTYTFSGLEFIATKGGTNLYQYKFPITGTGNNTLEQAKVLLSVLLTAKSTASKVFVFGDTNGGYAPPATPTLANFSGVKISD